MNRLFTAILLTVLASPPAGAGEQEDIAAAQSAAVAWLALVDQGRYEEVWEDAAPLMKAAVSSADLQRSLTVARGPFGELQSREVAKSSFHTTLPGAPDGEYVVFTFSTSFADKAQAVETVTAMKVSDGTWRVAGYFVK